MLKHLTLSVVALALMLFAGCGGTAPGAPTGLAVTATSPITLSWTGVSGITNYNVYRGTASGGLIAKTLLAGNVSSTTYADSTATAGTTFYYQVTAVNSGGESLGSNEVHAIAQLQPSSSLSLSGTKVASQIALTWSTVSGAASYNVYRSTKSEAFTLKTQIAKGISLTTYYADTDQTLTSGVTYYYQVTAANASGGEFLLSNEASVAF